MLQIPPMESPAMKELLLIARSILIVSTIGVLIHAGTTCPALWFLGTPIALIIISMVLGIE